MRKLAFIAVASAAFVALADVFGNYNTWLGYLAGDNANGNRVTYMGAGAGGESQDILRSCYMGAAAGAYSYNVKDSVALGYRALYQSSSVSNCVAIGQHALANLSMGDVVDATWINGHFVANPPRWDGSSNQQTFGEFYITGDKSLTNNLAPIWYDGTNLHLRGFSPGGVTNAITYVDLIGLTSCAVEQEPWFRNEVTYCPQKAKVAFYASDDWTEGENLGESDKVPMVYLRKNATSGTVEVWEGTTKLGTLTLDP